MNTSADKHQQYLQKKNEIIQSLKQINEAGHPIRLGKKTSNLFRNRKLSKSHTLDVTKLNQVIKVDPESLIVEVEGMTTFEDLVSETLKFNCLPQVVPELKTITAGGAVTGVAIESSSFRYGLVHETVVETEVLLSSGEVVTCTSDNEHRDLFYAFPNSYGSFGYILKLKMKLIPAKPYVKLIHQHFSDPKTYFEKMRECCNANHNNGPITYIDGTAFHETDLYLTTGEFADEAPHTSNYKYMNIYYRSIQTKQVDYLTTQDYIWRWDTDWFWCSKNFGMQAKLPRLLLGKFLLKSSRFWKIMYISRNNSIIKMLEKWFAKPVETVIQDIEVPISNAEAFHAFFHQNIGIKPVWMCPLKTYNPNVQFNLYSILPDEFFVNFGFWDTVPSDKEEGHYNRLIEDKVTELKGHKSLYSDVFYDKDTFWKLFDQTTYQKIKTKYDPKDRLRDLYTKVTR